MASFCKQCSEDLLGEDYGDMAEIVSEEEEAKGLMALVLCEGCGPIQVNRAGECLSVDCDECHGKKD